MQAGEDSRVGKHRPRWRAALVAILAISAATMSAAPAKAETITGQVVVTKPYEFTVGDYTVYLLGVDSMEVRQTCRIGRDEWECWAAAQRALEQILSLGEVVCETVVGPDAENRTIATCTVGGLDVGEEFVRSGFGLTIPAETEAYEEAQAAAREADIGLWQSTFTPPAIWRSLPMRPTSDRPDF